MIRLLAASVPPVLLTLIAGLFGKPLAPCALIGLAAGLWAIMSIGMLDEEGGRDV